MSKETMYFSHDCHARSDRKIMNLRMKHGMEGVGIYWCVVEMLYENNGYLPLEYDRITFELRTDLNVLRDVIDAFDLFIIDENRFYSEAVLDRLLIRMNKSENARKSISSRWKKDSDTNVLRTNTERNTKKKRKEKEIYSSEFLTFYEAYPNKKDKKSAFVAWNKLNGSRPELSTLLTAINNQAEWRKKSNGEFRPEWKNPATWLNKGSWEDEIKVEKAAW